MYIAGRDPTLNTIHEMGDISYCTNGVDKQVSWSAAIGGCGLKQIEHVNAYTTIARLGVYKPYATILEVKNSEGQVIKKWQDSGKQVIDPQVPYMLTDILSDDSARVASYGRGVAGLNTPGVKTFAKTGASNAGKLGQDLWLTGASTKVAVGLWVGNHDTKPLANVPSVTIGPTFSKIMGPLHTKVFGPDKSWDPGAWFKQPAGIQRMTVNGRNDIWPSWYNRAASNPTVKMAFDQISKKKATECTPAVTKIELDVQKFTDVITKRDTYFAPDGYDPTSTDDVHQCNEATPYITGSVVTKQSITITVSQGAHPIESVSITINGQTVTQAGHGAGDYVFDNPENNANATGSATVKDTAGYVDTQEIKH